MKRLNNKGFAISTILFSILILGTLVFGTLYATTTNSKECKNKCCEPPCTIPKKEVVNEDHCTGEFIMGSEHFCVLYSDSNWVVALAKYNLNLGCKSGDEGCSYPRFISGEAEGLQSAKTKNLGANGTVAALSDPDINNGSNKYGNYKTINVNSKVDKYNQTQLQHLDNLKSGMTGPINSYVNNYRNKLKTIITSNNLNIADSDLVVRLLNYDDLSDTNNFNCKDVLGKTFNYYKNNDNVNYSLNNSYGNNRWDCEVNDNNEWLYWTNYWTGVVNYGGQVPLYNFTIMGGTIAKDDSGANDDINGVRPVIEIRKDAYNRMQKA